jgi:hypothetical protein
MEKGDVLTGSMACKPAARAGASLAAGMLDVDVEVAFKGMTARVGYTLRRAPPAL